MSDCHLALAVRWKRNASDGIRDAKGNHKCRYDLGTAISASSLLHLDSGTDSRTLHSARSILHSTFYIPLLRERLSFFSLPLIVTLGKPDLVHPRR